MRDFLSLLRKEREIIDIHEEVDPFLEIAEIHRRVIEKEGPALFFHNVKGSSFPVVTNLFGTPHRIDLAFGGRPEEIIQKTVSLLEHSTSPSLRTLWQGRHLLSLGGKKKNNAPVLEHEISPPDLDKLPLLTSWPLDGGPFITLPLVATQAPGEGSLNIGIYRIQRFGKREAGLHFQIAKGGGFHYHLAEEKNANLPVAIFIGSSPQLMLAAITPLPENLSELLFASLISGKKIPIQKKGPYTLLTDCEFALLGHAKPHQRRKEGPFGDHYGYYSLAHDYPLFECEKIFHREGAIYPATVVGKPKQEDYYLGNYLQKLLLPLLRLMIPGLKDFWSYGEAGFHTVASAVVKERYHREAMTTAFRILGESQLALTKSLFITEKPIPLNSFKKVLTHILERFLPERDLFVFSNLSLDTLDYTGPKLNEGSRLVWLGLGEKKRELPEGYEGPLLASVHHMEVFCPGCLVLEVPLSFQEIDQLLQHPSFNKWPLLILVDNAKQMVSSETLFLWTLFTRFEPAADLHSRKITPHRHHLCYEIPLLIDARMKPTYPPEVEGDPKTIEKVKKSFSNSLSF